MFTMHQAAGSGSGHPRPATRRAVNVVFVLLLLAAAAGLRYWPVASAAQEPAPQFGWSMLPRHTGTSLVDPNDLEAAQAYVNPGAYGVAFDGCAALVDDMATVTHTYTITGASLPQARVVSKTAGPTRIPPKLGGGFEPIDCADLRVITHLPQGSYTVKLHAEEDSGYNAESAELSITVKDILIISVGDSYGSGEGAPDREIQYGVFGFPEVPAGWQDQGCHRSAWAGASQAAAILERSNPYTSVTFISLACSGATINTPIDDNPDDGNPGVLNMARYQGAGLLTEYSGIEHDGSYNPDHFLPPQMEQAALIANNRAIDALTISGGGNDMHFANVIIDCVLSDCQTNQTTANRMAADFVELPNRYQELADFINDPRENSDVPALNITPDRVFISEYPDPTRDMNGDWCQVNQLDDPLLAFPVTGITRNEMAWASANVVTPLNQAIQGYAGQHGWNYVDGISEEFFGNPAAGQPGRGWCALGEDEYGAPNNWINRSMQSLAMQGPVTIPLGLIVAVGVAGIVLLPLAGASILLTLLASGALVNELKGTAGTMHPNRMGQMVYARHIASAIQNRLNGVLPQPSDTTPPTIDAMQDISVVTGDRDGAAVEYAIPATHDNADPDGLATCAPFSGSVFPVGTSQVTCTASDASGNQAAPVTFNVTVDLVMLPLPAPPDAERILASSCVNTSSDDFGDRTTSGALSFDGEHVDGYNGPEGMKVRSDAQGDNCGVQAIYRTGFTVEAGTSGLAPGDEVLLQVTLGLDGVLGTTRPAAGSARSQGDMGAHFTVTSPNSPACWEEPGCPEPLSFFAGSYATLFGPDSSEDGFFDATWSVDTNVDGLVHYSRVGDYCEGRCGDAFDLPLDTGRETYTFAVEVGEYLTVDSSILAFSEAANGGSAYSDYFSTFEFSIIEPAPGYKGVDVVYDVRSAENQPPTVEAGGPYSVDEGGSVDLSATAGDLEGGDVFVAWDLDGDGSFETTGANATFSAADLDGPATRSIAVQATDAEGLTATAEAVGDVLNVAPSAAIVGAPATGTPGVPIDLTSVVTDPAPADAIGSAWSVKKDGASFASGTGAAFSFTPDGAGSYVVTLIASDDDGDTGSATAEIQVAAVENSAPVVTLGEDVGLHRGETLTSAGSFADPDADAWTGTVDYGDGSGVQALALNPDRTFAISHTYTTAGTFTVTVCVADEAAQGCDTLGVTVVPYAIFAGRADCGSGNVEAINLSGSQGTAFGDLHSNSGLKVSGSKNRVEGATTYRCTKQVGSTNTFASGPTQVSEVRPWPVQLDATAFICDLTVVGKLDLSADGTWWVGGTKASRQLAPLTLCADEIVLGESNVTGTVTLVAGKITLSGSTLQLTAHQHGVLAYASGTGTDAIKVSGSNNVLAGDLVAPVGGIEAPGSSNRITGGLIGWTVTLSGSNWTIDARAPAAP